MSTSASFVLSFFLFNHECEFWSVLLFDARHKKGISSFHRVQSLQIDKSTWFVCVKYSQHNFSTNEHEKNLFFCIRPCSIEIINECEKPKFVTCCVFFFNGWCFIIPMKFYLSLAFKLHSFIWLNYWLTGLHCIQLNTSSLEIVRIRSPVSLSYLINFFVFCQILNHLIVSRHRLTNQRFTIEQPLIGKLVDWSLPAAQFTIKSQHLILQLSSLRTDRCVNAGVSVYSFIRLEPTIF